MNEPNALPQQTLRRQMSKLRDAFALLLVLGGLYWFAASFFLAKRSLTQTSHCHEALTLLQTQLGLTPRETALLVQQQILLSPESLNRPGCWMERRVDSVIILLVDALRFDFAYYNLPRSIGQRLQQSQQNHINNHNSSSRLFQFIADPPTVTMQRLKGLTSGSLPTFADISGNFGGAHLPEDSWVKQLVKTPFLSRGLTSTARTAFVGDDTWQDLFPNYFVESYPYPSFNTRDLETVDNGCLDHLPDLLQRLRTSDTDTDTEKTNANTQLEVVVVHFLGVDHVGHTYGPHNEHMDTKLRQMDAALATVLELLDDSKHSCHAALIFGDHGMTPDGNHGGGTPDETHAALFVHASAGCAGNDNTGKRQTAATLVDTPYLHDVKTASQYVTETFSSLHQIDLVPVIAILLGLPIPFANLGGLVPSLLPVRNHDLHDIRHVTAALALNAAQVWRYFDIYSTTANRLPHLPELHEQLTMAATAYQYALSQEQTDKSPSDAFDDSLVDAYAQAATLLKSFLTEALELGQRVWTRFDTAGMVSGIVVLTAGLVLYALPLVYESPRFLSIPRSHQCEMVACSLFMLFLCGILTFSNSYILQEEDAIMFCLAVLSTIIALRMQSDMVPSNAWKGVALLPVASRFDELFASGHGMDSSVRLHVSHHSFVFLSSLLLLAGFRWYLYRQRVLVSKHHAWADFVTLACFAGSWLEKRSLDPDRNGYWYSRVGLVILFVGIPLSMVQAWSRPTTNSKVDPSFKEHRLTSDVLTVLTKILITIMAVTGPSAAPSLVLYSFQAAVIYVLSVMTGPQQVHTFVLASLWRLVTRHIFFATNHGCFFNRLQYSAAFIATKEFYFALGGVSLFLNTFGWEMVGLTMAWLMSQRKGRSQLWRIYCVFQLVEALTSCLSVSVLRRHLMVWDIYAPHFLFAGIYTVLSSLSQLTALALVET